MSHPTYTTGETITRTDVVRIGKGKVDYSVTLPVDPFTADSVEIENLATGRHRVVPAARLTLIASAAPVAPVAPTLPVVADGPTLAELEAARERAAANLTELFGDGEADDVERCHVCGEPNDYCQGHGELGDSRGWSIALAHDFGDHQQCHPAGCEAAGTTEHADYPHSVGYLDACAACVSGGCVCCYSPETLAPCVSAECERREADDDDEQTYPEWTERPADDGRRFGGALAVVVALAVWFLSGAFASLVASPTAYASPVPVVTEDSPEWNCATMGDHECGPRAGVPAVPAGCFPVLGRPGNTLWIMLTPSGSAGCETGR